MLRVMSLAMPHTPPAPCFPMRILQLEGLNSCSSFGNALLPSFLAGRYGSCSFWGIGFNSTESLRVTKDDKFWSSWIVWEGHSKGCRLLSELIQLLFLTVTWFFASLSEADNPCFAITIKLDRLVLTYRIWRLSQSTEGSLISRNKV